MGRVSRVNLWSGHQDKRAGEDTEAAKFWSHNRPQLRLPTTNGTAQEDKESRALLSSNWSFFLITYKKFINLEKIIRMDK